MGPSRAVKVDIHCAFNRLLVRMHVKERLSPKSRTVEPAVDGPTTIISVTVVRRLGILVTPSNPITYVPLTVVAVGFAATTETGASWSIAKKPGIVIFWPAVNVERHSKPRRGHLVSIFSQGILKVVMIACEAVYQVTIWVWRRFGNCR